MLELRRVVKSYREGRQRRLVFDGLEARFLAGEFVAITGRSGSGKSTFLNLACGIDLPDSGEIRLDGDDIATLADRERTLVRRRKVGFIFQFFNLLPTLSVIENLLLPQELIGRPDAEARRRAQELLGGLGLGDRADSFVDVLSGGEQQRVAIARALVHDPALILADEPTGNLDAETGAEVLALLDRLVRDEGRLLLMVTHSAEAAARADRQLRIEDGTLTEAR